MLSRALSAEHIADLGAALYVNHISHAYLGSPQIVSRDNGAQADASETSAMYDIARINTDNENSAPADGVLGTAPISHMLNQSKLPTVLHPMTNGFDPRSAPGEARARTAEADR